jgi:hypothetical protein
MSISIAQARSLLLCEQVNEINAKRKANGFYNHLDKAGRF